MLSSASPVCWHWLCIWHLHTLLVHSRPSVDIQGLTEGLKLRSHARMSFPEAIPHGTVKTMSYVREALQFKMDSDNISLTGSESLKHSKLRDMVQMPHTESPRSTLLNVFFVCLFGIFGFFLGGGVCFLLLLLMAMSSGSHATATHCLFHLPYGSHCAVMSPALVSFGNITEPKISFPIQRRRIPPQTSTESMPEPPARESQHETGEGWNL